MRTQVAIVGAGPAGLLLSHLLHLAGHRLRRAGERAAGTTSSSGSAPACSSSRTVELLRTAGRRRAAGPRGPGHRRHRAALRRARATASHFDRADRPVDHRLRPAGGGQGPHRGPARADGQIVFEAADVAARRLDGDRAARDATARDGEDHELRVRRHRRLRRLPRRLPRRDPAGVLRVYERDVPVRLARASWPQAPPVARGADLRLPRARASPCTACARRITRLYLQVRAGRGHRRLARRPDLGGAAARGWRRPTASRLTEGPILEKGITGMRSFVVEPMQLRPAVPGRRRRAHRPAHRRQGHEPGHRRRARAGRRVRRPATRTARPTLLDGYWRRCLRRVWRASTSPGG